MLERAFPPRSWFPAVCYHCSKAAYEDWELAFLLYRVVVEKSKGSSPLSLASCLSPPVGVLFLMVLTTPDPEVYNAELNNSLFWIKQPASGVQLQ